MTKLFYIANIRFPTERAHGIQVAHMCSAFARNGAEVTLLVPDRATISEDPFLYYGNERNFIIEKIPVPDTVRWGILGFLVESLVFARRAARRVRVEGNTSLNPPSKDGGREIVVYTREELPLLFLPDNSVFYEAHQLRRNQFFQWIIRRARGIIAITNGLKDALVRIGFPEAQILVAHDGYDEKQFSASASKEEAREKLGLPKNKKIAMYVGGFEEWKGVKTLCESARFLADDDILVVIIGGTNEEIGNFPHYGNIKFLGARPYRELQFNLQAADILVVPNSSKLQIGSIFTSPLKLFAYMASGVAMVVADVPALMEVVESTQVFKFKPDNQYDLANTIKRALSSEWLSEWQSKAEEAKKKVKDFTWDKRAEKILRVLLY